MANPNGPTRAATRMNPIPVTSSLRMGTAPGVGGLFPNGDPASFMGGPPSQTTLLGYENMPVVATQFDTSTNTPIPYARLPRSMVSGHHTRGSTTLSVNKGQLVFIRRPQPTNSPMDHRLQNLGRELIVNLPILNDFLCTKQGSACSVEDVMSTWALDGVVQSDMLNGDERISRDPIMNNHVGGRTTALNIWGPGMTDGTHLYLIIKKEALLPQDYLHMNISTDCASPLSANRDEKQGQPVQIRPWAIPGKSKPDMADLAYTVNGTTHYGECIHVGRVNRPGVCSHTSPAKPTAASHGPFWKRVSMDIITMLAQPKLEMMVDIKTVF